MDAWFGEKKFGFGFMRLPMRGDAVDLAETTRMVDAFLESGFCYFDTAHGYLDGKSETALRECLTARYPRDRYILTDKLSGDFFKTQADIRPLFERQLRACGVDYFDFYLMHSQNAAIYARFCSCRAYETALELQREGKFRHFGISFHDRAEVLEEILTAYPQIEVVQLQLNYMDFDDPVVQSGRCLEVCKRYGKPVIVMEPVKGGNLANLPQEAQAVLDGLGGGSPASYAIRFAMGFDEVAMVLSGMSDLPQMADNLRTAKDFLPLTERETEAIGRVKEIFRAKPLIPCTACRYCVAGCPQNILIPDLFACMNKKQVFRNWNTDYYYSEVYTAKNGKASDCVKCGRCERACPQHLPIRDLLRDVAAEFDR